MKRYSLGEQLRAARIKKELSLYDVEKVSGVEAQYLLAMEMDQLKALPKDIQQEALEKYATSVDLDGKHLYEEQKKNERKVKEEKKQVERKEDILDTKVPMSRFSKLKREEKRKSNYIPLLILSAVSLLIICSVGYIIIRHLSNQPQVIKPNTISTVNHLSIASGAKSSRSISEVTVSGANVTTTTQGNQLMVDLSNVKSSVVLEVELSENSNDTWFSVDNSDTSESYYLSKTNKSKYSLDLSDKIKTTQIIIAQPSKVTLKVNGESLDLSQLDQNTPSYLTLRIPYNREEMFKKENLPNLLTLARIILIPIFLLMTSLASSNVMHIAAAVVFAIASITDHLDGYLARKWHVVTNFGKFADPLADKMLVMSAFIMLVGINQAPAWVISVIICRELAVTGLRLLLVENGGTVLAAAMPGKIKTVTQMLSIILLLCHVHFVGTIMLYVALFFTIYSGYDYFKGAGFLFKDTFK